MAIAIRRGSLAGRVRLPSAATADVMVLVAVAGVLLALPVIGVLAAADPLPLADPHVARSGTEGADLEWTKWVRVSWWAGNSQPAWLDRDAARQYALESLQPDIVDWYQGLDMNRGQFFRKRGVAVCTGSSWEYDQDFAMQVRSPKLTVGCSHPSLHTNNLPCYCPRPTARASRPRTSSATGSIKTRTARPSTKRIGSA